MPSMSYKDEKNPRKALALAVQDVEILFNEEMCRRILSVEMSNDRREHVKVHRRSLGPNNPHCLDCGKPEGAWSSVMEQCIPT